MRFKFGDDVAKAVIAQMGLRDWFSVFLSTIVITMSVQSVVRYTRMQAHACMRTNALHKHACSDIKFCKIAREQLSRTAGSNSRGWQLILALHRHIFCYGLCTMV